MYAVRRVGDHDAVLFIDPQVLDIFLFKGDVLRNAGPQGKAFIEGLETAPTETRLKQSTVGIEKNGTVVPLSNTGGGITIRPSDSTSGGNEVYYDPSNLINYQATDGTTVTETPQGLLLHELGHTSRLNSGDPAQTTGGATAELNVRTTTNPIRTELKQKPEA